MTYRLTFDDVALDQIDHLPVSGMLALSEAYTVLSLTPWNGSGPEGRPDAPVRTLPFGRWGMVTYLVLEDRLQVDVLRVEWVDLEA